MSTPPEPKPRPGRPGPLKLIPRGYRKACIACGRRIRWALASCVDCNAVILGDTWPKRFIAFS